MLHGRIKQLYGDHFATLAKEEDDWLNKAIQRVLANFLTAAKEVYDVQDMQPEMLTIDSIAELHDSIAESIAHSIDIKLEDTSTSPNFKSLGVKLKDDIYIFSGFKTYHELKEASALLRDEHGRLKTFDAFLEDIKGMNAEYNVNYLKSEYNYAKNTAFNAEAYADGMAYPDEVDFVYKTQHDGKVRPEHAELHNICYPVNHVFWSMYMPPNGWGCRCFILAQNKGRNAYPENDDEALARGARAVKNEMFVGNPLAEGAVFPKNHPYYGDSQSIIHQEIKKEIEK